MISDALAAKLKQLPASPGVYFHKDKSGDIIYIGKAAVLKNRVRQYFGSTKNFDPKTMVLVSEIVDVDWQTVDSELDALFLESELVKRYKPRFNILLRDDKAQTFIRISRDSVPVVGTTRQPVDDGAEYFGPYFNGLSIKKALRLLRRTFPFYTKRPGSRVDLDHHLGLTPSVDQAASHDKYLTDIAKLKMYIRGNRVALLRQLDTEMKLAAEGQDFELAARRRNQIWQLKQLQTKILFGDQEFLDINKDHALLALAQLLSLPGPPKRIEGYDISHMQGTNNVASMVVMTNGLADKQQYRKFKMQTPGNDDFAHMREVMKRRFAAGNAAWPRPDLILIDGGKGQLSSALQALAASDEYAAQPVPVIGLAKREEEIIVHRQASQVMVAESQLRTTAISEVSGSIERVDERRTQTIVGSQDFLIIHLGLQDPITKLLQRLRDESHRFAVSYHSYLKRSGQVKSELDAVPGVGPATKKRLLVEFGSVVGIRSASTAQLAACVGLLKAKTIQSHLPPRMLE